MGLKRYKRLNFSISSAAEVFQNSISQALDGFKGVRNISDDILVWGIDDDDHDKNLQALFKRLREKNLTLNKSKCMFKVDKIATVHVLFLSMLH